MSFGSGEGPAVRSPQVRRSDRVDETNPETTTVAAVAAAAAVGDKITPLHPQSPGAAAAEAVPEHAEMPPPPQTPPASAPIPIPGAIHHPEMMGHAPVYYMMVPTGSPPMGGGSPPGQPPADDHVTITRRIPNDQVGRIIGKQGSTIREIQERTGATVYMPKQDAPADDSYRDVEITGTQQQVKLCDIFMRMKISPDKIDELTEEARKYEIPLVTQRIRVPLEHIGRVIGKGGATIRLLQETTGAHVDLPKESEPGETCRIVTISGSAAAVAHCADMLLARITPREDGGMAGPSPPSSVPTDITGLHVFIPNDLVGSIIGRRGAKIKEIQEMSGARIFLPKECMPSSNVRDLVISGPEPAQQQCLRLINETMETARMQTQQFFAAPYAAAGYSMSPPHMPYFATPYAPAGGYFVPATPFQFVASPPEVRRGFQPQSPPHPSTQHYYHHHMQNQYLGAGVQAPHQSPMSRPRKAAAAAPPAPPPSAPAAASSAESYMRAGQSGTVASPELSQRSMRSRHREQISTQVPSRLLPQLTSEFDAISRDTGAEFHIGDAVDSETHNIVIFGDHTTLTFAKSSIKTAVSKLENPTLEHPDPLPAGRSLSA